MIAHKTNENGFAFIEVSNKSASAEIALQGAHLFSFKPVAEQSLLWLSKKSLFESGKAIRGGIPICWPWFGRHPENSALPQHGFARISKWELVDVHEPDEQTTEIQLQLHHGVESLQLWPYKFTLLLTFTIGRTLSLALTTKNCDVQPFEITAALHSYFAVENIQTVHVDGLAGRPCFDSLTGKEYVQQGSVRIDQEVDRIYHKVEYPVILHDQQRSVRIDASGSSSAVLWNPWRKKSAAMADMHDDAYTTMLCIETANAPGDARRIKPGQEHTLRAVISS